MAEQNPRQPPLIRPARGSENDPNAPRRGGGGDRSNPHATNQPKPAQEESISRQNIALMRRIRARDETALEELYDRYAGSVYGIATHILHHRSDAEEVVTETFWEIWHKADRYDPSRGSVLSYILLMARSRAIDRSRRSRSRESAEHEFQNRKANAEPTTGDEAGPPEADAILCERRERVRALLEQLPADRRVAIEMSFLKGLSHQQIAETLNVPLGTIKTRIRQGLIQLYEQMRISERGSSE